MTDRDVPVGSRVSSGRWRLSATLPVVRRLLGRAGTMRRLSFLAVICLAIGLANACGSTTGSSDGGTGGSSSGGHGPGTGGAAGERGAGGGGGGSGGSTGGRGGAAGVGTGGTGGGGGTAGTGTGGAAGGHGGHGGGAAAGGGGGSGATGGSGGAGGAPACLPLGSPCTSGGQCCSFVCAGGCTMPVTSGTGGGGGETGAGGSSGGRGGAAGVGGAGGSQLQDCTGLICGSNQQVVKVRSPALGTTQCACLPVASAGQCTDCTCGEPLCVQYGGHCTGYSAGNGLLCSQNG
jgi:hypothetical protein